MRRRAIEAVEPKTMEVEIPNKSDRGLTVIGAGVAGTAAYFLQSELLFPFIFEPLLTKYSLTGGAAQDDAIDPAILTSTGVTLLAFVFFMSDPASRLGEWLLNGIKQCLHMHRHKYVNLDQPSRDNQFITLATVEHPYVLNGIRMGIKGFELAALQALVIGGSAAITATINNYLLSQNEDDAVYSANGRKVSYIAVPLIIIAQLVAAYASHLLLKDWHYREPADPATPLRWNNLLNILNSLRRVIASINKFPGTAHEWLTTFDVAYKIPTASQCDNWLMESTELERANQGCSC